MDNCGRPKRQADDAVTRLTEDYEDAVEAFHRLEAAHRQGNLAPGLAESFRTKARQVHSDVAAARTALAELRSAMSLDTRPSTEAAD